MNPRDDLAERSNRPALPRGTARPAREQGLWETARANLLRALQRVEIHQGTAGVDGRSVAELRSWLKAHWPEVRRALDAGRYRPSPVRQVTIPKPDGGERKLGVPTALDRLIQQAIAQALTPIFDPGLSPHSYGFRQGRSGQPNHVGVICTNGTACAPGTRNLRDLFEDAIDPVSGKLAGDHLHDQLTKGSPLLQIELPTTAMPHG